MNDRWTNVLPQYYDYIQDEYLKWMAEEYSLPLEELKAKAEPLKDKILESASSVVTTMNTGIHKKPSKFVPMVQSGAETPYDNLPRNKSFMS